MCVCVGGFGQRLDSFEKSQTHHPIQLAILMIELIQPT